MCSDLHWCFPFSMADKKIETIHVYVHPRMIPHRAMMTIGNQSFTVCEREVVEEAEWYCTMLVKAFDKAGVYVSRTIPSFITEE